MSMTEGNTLNVPELRRLLAEAEKAREAAQAAQAADGAASRRGQMSPESLRRWTHLLAVQEAAAEAAFKAAPALLDVVERVEKLEHLAETVRAVIEDSATVGGPTWVPVSKGVFEAMREALAALGKAGPS